MGCHGDRICDDCLDWRADQSQIIGAHIGTVVRNILGDLGIDTDDEHVREVCARRLREADPTA